MVEGATRSALYDLTEGKVYSLNRSAHKVLVSAEKGVVKKRHRGFLGKLIDLGILETSDAPFPPREEPEEEGPDAKLQFVWLEVTSKCNLSCLHCYGDCLSSPGPDRMNEEGWKSIILQARGLGCSQIQFIGGEPLLRKDLFELVDFAISQGFIFVEIFSNLTLFKKESISFLRERGIYIATTLYSFNPHTHDLITGAKGSHAKTVAAITRLRDSGIPVRVAVIAMRHNQDELSATVDFLQRMGVDYKMPDPVRPTGRGCSREIQPFNLPQEFSGQMTEAKFWTDKYSFYFNKRFNSCWGGKLAITAAGEVIPCIFARDLVIGNVLEKGLEDILQDNRLKEFWGLTKEQVEVCQDCEYRYACHDCRPLAYTQKGGLYAKPPRCLYDPYRGLWRKK
ncbi:MAG: radical SAM protein [Deltaproteobacteria bacterium]|nr:radical SAM protein [Deltaproteobacteria bacterium]